MKLTLHRPLCTALVAVAGVFGWTGHACALTLAEGLDTPGIAWTDSTPGSWLAVASAQAHDGADLVEIPELSDDFGNTPLPVLSTPVTGPAVIRFWWRFTTAVTDPALYIGVDDVFAHLPSNYYDNSGWIPVEMHLSPGPHVFSLRPFTGTGIQVDEVRITAGPGSLVQAAGDASLSWLIVNGGWNVSADAPPGMSASAAWGGGGQYPVVYGLFPPGSKIEGWFKRVTPGYMSIHSATSQFYYPARGASVEWQRFRVVAPGRWVTFSAWMEGTSGVPAPDLKLAGITSSPAGPGDILDAPELSWTAFGSRPFVYDSNEAGEHGTGCFSVSGEGAFTAGFRTVLTGPGRLFFTSQSFRPGDDRMELILNGAGTNFPPHNEGAWERFSLAVPAGAVTAEFRATNADANGQPDWGHFVLDDVTMCAPANAAQKEALDLPAASELWMRQSEAGMWTRTTSVSRDGVDSLVLASSSGLRRADLMLPTGGAPLVGAWIKTTAETKVSASRIGEGLEGVRTFRPAPGAGWTWMPLHAGPDTTYLRLTVPAMSDKGAEIFLDNYGIYQTVVPVAEALETPGREWQGNHGLAVPGSDTADEKVAALPGGRQVSTFLNTPAVVKYRYRFCASPAYGDASLILNGGVIANLGATAQNPDPPLTWQEKEVLIFSSGAESSLVFRCFSGAVLIDKVEIKPLAEVTIPEALDAPGLTVAQSNDWRGLSGVGHDNIDTVISPLMAPGPDPSDPSKSELVVNTAAAGSVDGGFWWKRDTNEALLHFQIAGDTQTPGRFYYAGGGWRPVRLHCDQAPSQMTWTQSMSWSGSAVFVLPRGNVMLDELLLTSGAPDTFGSALDSAPAGPNMPIGGWNALGDAAVAVQTAVTWQDGDALEIRPVPGGAATQSSKIFSRFSGGTDFSCRVKRGSLTSSTLTLVLADQPFAEIPLSAEWTEFRLLLPPHFGTGEQWITLLATVPDAGPEAVIYLDAVSLTEAADFNTALETTGLTWTGTGSGRQAIGVQPVPDYGFFPPYAGSFDGVGILDLTSGQQRRLGTVMTGPGTVVFTGYHSPDIEGDWRTSLLIDNVAGDSLPLVPLGVFRLQAFLPAGTHTVRWLVQRDSGDSTGTGGLQLHSVALVPGLPSGLLPSALQTIAPNRTWVNGGTRPPEPLYSLKEGVTAVNGIFFPAWTPGESSWIETSITGPARVSFTWQSAVIAACYLDGSTACRTFAEPGSSDLADPRTVMHVPAGTHTVRWANSQGITAKLREFSVTPGSDIAGVLAGGSPPVVWLYEPQESTLRTWQVVTDGTLQGIHDDGTPFAVPGTGLPVLGAGDRTTGSFWVHGPAVVSYEIRRRSGVPLLVGVDQEILESRPWPGSFGDIRWRPDAVVVPAGHHLVSFTLREDELGNDPYIFLKNIRIRPGLQWVTWAFGIGLVSIKDSSPFADPDNDGINNLMEFAFGTQPRSASGPVGPQLTGTPDQPRLQFPALPWEATDVTYDVEMSADLESWTSFTTVHPNPPGQPGPSVSLPAPQAGRKFYRVTVKL